MTGYGEAHRQENDLAVAVEVRTINSRYFKLTMRCGEGYSLLEPEVEAVIRQQIKRGTVQVFLRVDRSVKGDDYQLNVAVLDNYRKQLIALQELWGTPQPIAVDKLLMLPGVVDDDPVSRSDATEDWPVIRATLEAALANMAKMRADEGRAMGEDLKTNCGVIAKELAGVELRAPLVVSAYRTRLHERVNKLLEEYQVSLDPGDLVKEVSIYSDRSDISEEIVRLKSHLVQFDEIMALPESSGRKLEFLTQEMFRETNTIGSKSNDVQIARHVIEMKAAIEKIREMIQNVE
jgi:uncharacterized protein (TIGR00255 family)